MDTPPLPPPSSYLGYTITKRLKPPSEPPSEDEFEEQNKFLTQNGDAPQEAYCMEYSVSDDEEDLKNRKAELEKIVIEEEKIRKRSLLNLRQELDSIDSRESLDPSEYHNNHKNANVNDKHAVTSERNVIKPTLSRDFSFSSHWTTDEEGGGSQKVRRRRSKKYNRRRRNTFTDEELQKIPRLVHRNMPFKQSRQEIAVVNKTVFRGLKVQRILSQDWYHVFLKWNTAFSLLLLLSVWTLVITVFALIYMKMDSLNPMVECGLGSAGNPIAFGPAFAFSLETTTTVGYGLPNGTNSFFEPECGHLQVFIYFQMVFSMLFNAFLFAFLFARLARCEQRGAQILFCNKAIIEKRNGKWLMHVRVYDYASSLPIVEAHARMYCVSWRDYEKQTRDLVQPHLLHQMRILQPDDDLGSSLFTSIPGNLTHQIDVFSPLLPKLHKKASKRMDSGGLVLRQIDQYINGTGFMCPVCGDVYGCLNSLRKHIEYSKVCENMDDFPIKGSHRDPDIIRPYQEDPRQVTEEELYEHLKDKEIMVVVEGIEPMVSGTFQALQSYKISDISFGGRFAPCMSQLNGKIFVDIDRFHEILPPSDDSVRNFNKFKLTETY